MPETFKHDFSDRPRSKRSSAARNRRKHGGINIPSMPALLRLPRFRMPALPNMPQLPSPGWFPLLGAIAGFISIIVFIGSAGDDVDASVSVPQEVWLNPQLELPSVKKEIVQSTKLASGDNAIAALVRLGFNQSESHALIAKANSTYKLKNIRAGQSFKRVDTDSGIDVYYNIDGEKRLHLHQQLQQSEWQAKLDKRQVHSRRRTAAGVIQDSLFVAAGAGGMDQRTTMNLVDIFAWDIDFARDLRTGDTFRVLYEERFDDEGKMLESSILAAEFVNQGNKFQAVRYEQANGKVDYFTPGGKSMRKAYLKAPVKFSRISSRFKLKRKHPVLGYTRAHRGVDYASPSGTPVHAIGDGFVTFKGWKGGYGRYVQIRHNNRNHTTSYAHLRSYAKGFRKGGKVRQGQVIGYVGMSGLATGPHLHFEFRSRGRAVNPLTVKHPPAQPVVRTERYRFKEMSTPLLGQLNQQITHLAWG